MHRIIDKIETALLVTAVLLLLAFAIGRAHAKRDRMLSKLGESFGFRIAWRSAFARIYCLEFDKPGWGGMLRLTMGPLGDIRDIHFVGLTMRPIPGVCVKARRMHDLVHRAAGSQGFDALVTEGTPDAVALLSEEILALMKQFEAQITEALFRMGNPLRLWAGGYVVRFEVSRCRETDEEHLVRALLLIESFMHWIDQLPIAAVAGACRACGEPDAGSQCGRCGSPYHDECWREARECRGWGCGDQRTKLRLLRKSMLSPIHLTR
ncbi:hypothetical protein [Polyangium mundeleinium]|uniref:Phorbol-ester/DAG-type domain-containing protein n=1 Tax=Polyangium mundeleinium TaxID=2995306 RepID=A0ABT5EHU1_9BACT|nr:hypothetical protein [Polyangium mundeleinium]MDC0740947.1 hypothetical protein [Polyangium mundeleinium]